MEFWLSIIIICSFFALLSVSVSLRRIATALEKIEYHEKTRGR
jgi:hypothetical protein